MKHCIYFLLFFTPFFVEGQNSFEKEIPSGEFRNKITVAYQLSDQSFALFETSLYVSDTYGGGYFTSYDNQVFLLDDSGNIKNNFYTGFCPVFCNDNLYYVGYIQTSAYLIKTDLKEDTMFQTALDPAFDNDGESFSCLSSDNNIIVVGIAYNPPGKLNCFLQKIDTNGTIVATQHGITDTVCCNYLEEYSNVFPTSDSGLYLVKFYLDNNSKLVTRFVQKYNSKLSMMFNKSISISGNIFQFNGDRNFYCLNQDSTGQIDILTYDEQFDLIDSINFHSSYNWEDFYRLADKGYFFVSRDSGNKMGQVDSTGNEIWVKQLYPGDTSAFSTNTILKTADNGFLICGSNDSSTFFYSDPDAMLFLPTSTCAVVKTGSFADAVSVVKAEEPFQLFPNPAVNELTVKVNAPLSSNAKIVITNILGQTCREGYYNFSGNSITVDVTNLTKAVYFIDVITNKEKWVSIFIKE